MAAGRTAIIQLPLQRFHSGPVLLHNLLDMGNAVEIHLELIELADYGRVACNLLVGAGYYVASSVILDLGEHVGLLAEAVDVVFDVGHELVEVTAQSGEGGAIEKQKALAAGSAGSTGTAGAAIQGGLALP